MITATLFFTLTQEIQTSCLVLFTMSTIAWYTLADGWTRLKPDTGPGASSGGRRTPRGGGSLNCNQTEFVRNECILPIVNLLNSAFCENWRSFKILQTTAPRPLTSAAVPGPKPRRGPPLPRVAVLVRVGVVQQVLLHHEPQPVGGAAAGV